jgi:teichuronic acid biosynthesis glycosyltransferase TuaG
MVSIITPCHNGSRFIGRSISSVLQQSYLDWELIITDDCSTDNSLDIIYSLAGTNPKVIIVPLKEKVGAAEARNIALRKAQGRYIAFLDSDDIWTPNKLERQLSFMISNNYLFTFTSYGLINESNEMLYKTIKVPRSLTYHNYLKNTIIGCLTVIIDRQQVGSFEMPDLRSSHDMALWLQILKKGIIAYGLNEELAFYRVVSNSNTSKKIRAALDVWFVYRRIEKLPIIYSSICFLSYAFNALIKRVL